MAIETTGDALAFISETRNLVHRAEEALRQSHKLGPVGLGELLEPAQRLQAALEMEVPQLERVVAERIR